MKVTTLLVIIEALYNILFIALSARKKGEKESLQRSKNYSNIKT